MKIRPKTEWSGETKPNIIANRRGQEKSNHVDAREAKITRKIYFLDGLPSIMYRK